MCQVTHYVYCVRVSNAARPPPNDTFKKREIHHNLSRDVQNGLARAPQAL
jgi:hypothetical protein